MLHLLFLLSLVRSLVEFDSLSKKGALSNNFTSSIRMKGCEGCKSIDRWEECDKMLENMSKLAVLLSYVHPDGTVRLEAKIVQSRILKLTKKILSDRQFYDVVVNSADGSQGTRRKLLLLFANYGMNLSDGKKEEFDMIQEEMDVISFRLSECSKLDSQCNDMYAHFDRLISLRQQKAALLGYKSHAHMKFASEPRMASSPEQVISFLKDILTKTEDQTIHRYEQIETGVTVEQILFVIGKFLQVRFELLTGVSAWHPDVFVYKVVDLDASGQVRGHVYFDIYHRPGRISNSATFLFDPPENFNDLASVAIVSNFKKLDSGNLTALNIKSLLHELGHALHFCLGRSHSPLPLDFAETTSQLFELWTSFFVQSLNPYEMLSVDRSQLVLAIFDMTIHSDSSSNNLGCLELLNGISRMCGLDTSFWLKRWPLGHLLRAYDAGYYSYSWSKYKYVSPTFELEIHGMFLNPLIGKKYKKCILWQEDIQDIRKSLLCFMHQVYSTGRR